MNGATSINGSGNVLSAGAGSATLIASGTGNLLQAGSGIDRLIASGADNRLIGASGMASLTVEGDGNVLIAGTGDADLVARGSNNRLTAGSGHDTLTVTGGSGNVLTGGSGDAVLSADGTDDTLIAGTGTTRLVANDGHNHFVFGGGGGVAEIVSGAAPTGGSNDLSLTNNLTRMDLSFLRTGDDLVIDTLDHQGHVTIDNYFGAPGNGLATIVTADHQLLTGTDIAQLVQSMAAFGADRQGFGAGMTAASFPPANDPAMRGMLAMGGH